MYEFLSFQTLISRQALIVFYYLGAVVMPVIMFFAMRRILSSSSTLQALFALTQTQLETHLSGWSRVKLWLAFVVLFMLMQLLWRMLFEFLIAFMQMRDALVAV